MNKPCQIVRPACTTVKINYMLYTLFKVWIRVVNNCRFIVFTSFIEYAKAVCSGGLLYLTHLLAIVKSVLCFKVVFNKGKAVVWCVVLEH